MTNRFTIALLIALLAHIVLIGLPLNTWLRSPSPNGSWTEPSFVASHLISILPKIGTAGPNESMGRQVQQGLSISSQSSAEAGGNTLTSKEIIQNGNTLPVYPSVALEKGWEGLVELKLTLSDQGRVVESVVVKSSGYQLLDEVAQRTSTNWKFEKYKGVKVLITPIRFTIDS